MGKKSKSNAKEHKLPLPKIDETKSCFDFANNSGLNYEYESDPVLRNYKLFRDHRKGFANLVDDFLETPLKQNCYDDDNIRRVMTFVYAKLIIKNQDKTSVPIMHDGVLLEKIVCEDSINDGIVGDILGMMNETHKDMYAGLSRYVMSLNDDKNWHLFAAGAFLYQVVSKIYERDAIMKKDVDRAIKKIFAEENHQKKEDESLRIIRAGYYSPSAKNPAREILPKKLNWLHDRYNQQ